MEDCCARNISQRRTFNKIMDTSKSFEQESFTDFLNEVNELATKYGWNVAGHEFEDPENENQELLQLILIPSIGSDALNKKF